jgi:hypothetical protein
LATDTGDDLLAIPPQPTPVQIVHDTVATVEGPDLVRVHIFTPIGGLVLFFTANEADEIATGFKAASLEARAGLASARLEKGKH